MADFQAWFDANKGSALFSALIIIFALFVFPLTRPYSVPLGIIFILTWYFKWQSKGGHL